jgi:type I restriction enzyme M protein
MSDIKDLEKTLWATADKLRSNMDAAEYKHVVLGLIFLKYISDAFNDLHSKLVKGEGEFEGADPEDADEYVAYNVFFVPETARWKYLQDRAKQPEIGKLIDNAMDEIEKINSNLKGVLPKIYADPELNKTRLGELIDLIGTIGFNQEGHAAKDLLGQVYEYFLGQFADAEGKKGGQFYTPSSIVKLLVEMLEPYEGRVYDGACGSGGMFVQSEKFVKEHQGNIKNLSIYGQESNPTTLRLAKMNLAIRGIDAKIELGDTFMDDKHKDLKADYILANPPFNISDWSGEQLREDSRWKYGVPPVGNANFAWLQHFINKLSNSGIAGVVLSNGSMNSNTGNEGEIRKNLVEEGLVDCMIALPNQLFYNTMIPACLWFLAKNRTNGKFRNRNKEILFIDARKMGIMVNRRNKELTTEEISKIATTYHNWRAINGNYSDIDGFCKSASIELVRQNNYVLIPSSFIDGIANENQLNFKIQIQHYNSILKKQSEAEVELNDQISNSFRKYYPESDWNEILYSSSEVIEHIAESIFTDWFVNYDYPNFSNELENSLIGEIPKEWKVSSIKDFGEIVCGKTPSKSNADFFGNEIPFVKIPDMHGKVFIINTEDSLSKSGGDSQRSKYIPSKSIMVSCIATVGLVSLSSKICQTNQQINSIVPHKKLHSYYLYFMMKRLKDKLKDLGSGGSATLNVNTTTFSNIQILSPDEKTLAQFNELVEPMFEKILFNLSQISQYSHD